MARRHRKKNSRIARRIISILVLCLLSALIGFYGIKFILTRGPGNAEESPAPVNGQEAEAPLHEDKAELFPHEETEVAHGPETPVDADTEEDSQTDTRTEEPAEPEMAVREVNLRLYAFQLGSFTTLQNAERFLKSIEEGGNEGVIWHSDYYRVLHMIYRDPAMEEFFKTASSGIVPEAFRYTIERTIEVSYNAGDENLVSERLGDYEKAYALLGALQVDYAAYVDGSMEAGRFSDAKTRLHDEIEAMGAKLGSAGEAGDLDARLKQWYDAVRLKLEENFEMEGWDKWDDLSELYTEGFASLEEGI